MTTKRTRKQAAVERLVLCKAFLATAAVCLDSAARRCGVRLWICVRKTVPVLGTKQNRNLVNNHYEKTLARTENFFTALASPGRDGA